VRLIVPLLVLSASGCVKPSEPRGSQPSVRAWAVIHVDPLSREGGEDCARSELFECGRPVAASWEQRTLNLEWFVETWQAAGRTVDVQLGPEMAVALAEDEEMMVALAEDFAGQGDVDGVILGAAEADERARARAVASRATLAAGLGDGTVSLGSHVHTVLPDGDGVWGTAPKRSEGASPCEAWADDPMGEAADYLVEEVVAYGAEGSATLAASLDSQVSSFTGHFPRTLAGKIAVVDDPDSLDPDVDRAFPAAFAPRDLGSAYSECLLQSVDHPPFEAWSSDTQEALALGGGPLVIPGERVVGSMAEHLDAPSDGSWGAVTRRILQLMLNWRWAGLQGEPGRAWVYTFHTHLFQLDPGQPDTRDPEAREVHTRDGVPLRGDADGVAAFLDSFAERGAWQGVSTEGVGVVDWVLPADVDEGSAFAYSTEGSAPPTTLHPDHYPYLPLVAERLAQTHLTCAGEVDGTEVYGLLRCDAGWSWGGQSQLGYHCTDAASPDWVYVLVPDGPSCVPLEDGGVQVGALDDGALGGASWCEGGLEVPDVGLIVEPVDAAPRWVSACAAFGPDA